ncbi:unnamed protein product, partial [Ixodes hexagonus]
YTPRGGGYTPRGGGYTPHGGGYTPHGTGYTPHGTGYTPPGAGYPPRGGGYAPRGGTHPARGGGWVPRGGGYGRGYGPQAAGQSYVPPRGPKPKKTSVSTWTVQVGEETFSYVARMKWKPRWCVQKGCGAEDVPMIFRGRLLTDRHPNEPKAVYTPEELEELCPTCGTLVIHWDTHVAGKLHQERLVRSKLPRAAAASVVLRTEPTPMDVMAALRVLQATRPDVIAASLAAAT